MSDLSVEAYRYLVNQPVIAQLVSEGILGSDAKYPKWVFRSDDGDPAREVGESGKCAIVVASSNTWAIKNHHNTASFPSLRVIIYADNTRDDTGTILKQDASDKCKEIYRRIDPLFHDPGRRITAWGDFRIHSCYAGSTFQINEMPLYDGSVYGLTTYDIITD